MMQRAEQRRGSASRTWMIVGVVVAAIILTPFLIGFVQGFGKGFERGSNTPATVNAGTPVRLVAEDWTVTATETRRLSTAAPDLGIVQPPAGTYVVVALDVENTAKSAQSLTALGLKLHDAQGRTHDLTIGPTVGYGSTRNGVIYGNRINPGLTAATGVVFDVPVDATGLQLQGVGGLRINLGDLSISAP